jgi:hypothetical protein
MPHMRHQEFESQLGVLNLCRLWVLKGRNLVVD